jgi:hypothetical protein
MVTDSVTNEIFKSVVMLFSVAEKGGRAVLASTRATIALSSAVLAAVARGATSLVVGGLGISKGDNSFVLGGY